MQNDGADLVLFDPKPDPHNQLLYSLCTHLESKLYGQNLVLD